MSTQTTAAERRLLTADELETVERTHLPQLWELADGELSPLLSRLRSMTSKWNDEARRQRREMRGKAPARGTRPAGDNRNSVNKAQIFTAAQRRVKKEINRRAEAEARARTAAAAQRALALKAAAEGEAIPDSGRSPRRGMRANPSARRAGFPDSNRDKGRLSAQVKRGQARRDAP